MAAETRQFRMHPKLLFDVIRRQAFYEEFHDHSETIGRFADTLLAYVPRVCASLGKRQTKSMLASQNRLVKAADAVKQFPNVGFRKP